VFDVVPDGLGFAAGTGCGRVTCMGEDTIYIIGVSYVVLACFRARLYLPREKQPGKRIKTQE
jgi:hypothetical protein